MSRLLQAFLVRPRRLRPCCPRASGSAILGGMLDSPMISELAGQGAPLNPGMKVKVVAE